MKKQEVISFKVNKEIAKKLEDLPNRSEFIRQAVTSALKASCPLCNGRGVLNDKQLRHWEEFTKKHSIKSCSSCDSIILTCNDMHEVGDS